MQRHKEKSRANSYYTVPSVPEPEVGHVFNTLFIFRRTNNGKFNALNTSFSTSASSFKSSFVLNCSKNQACILTGYFGLIIMNHYAWMYYTVQGNITNIKNKT